MSNKWNRFERIWASDIINTKNHWAVGINWPVVGSTGNEYTVTMVDRGWKCDCPAMKGKCKHIKKVESDFVGTEAA